MQAAAGGLPWTAAACLSAVALRRRRAAAFRGAACCDPPRPPTNPIHPNNPAYPNPPARAAVLPRATGPRSSPSPPPAGRLRKAAAGLGSGGQATLGSDPGRQCEVDIPVCPAHGRSPAKTYATRARGQEPGLDAGGIAAGSRWLSAATPPDSPRPPLIAPRQGRHPVVAFGSRQLGHRTRPRSSADCADGIPPGCNFWGNGTGGVARGAGSISHPLPGQAFPFAPPLNPG